MALPINVPLRNLRYCILQIASRSFSTLNSVFHDVLSILSTLSWTITCAPLGTRWNFIYSWREMWVLLTSWATVLVKLLSSYRLSITEFMLFLFSIICSCDNRITDKLAFTTWVSCRWFLASMFILFLIDYVRVV